MKKLLRKIKKLPSLSKFVVFSFACLITYTIVSQIIAVVTTTETTAGVDLSTLTTCFFAAFGGEVLMCALIKIFKLREGDKHGNEYSDDTADSYEPDDDTDHGRG